MNPPCGTGRMFWNRWPSKWSLAGAGIRGPRQHVAPRPRPRPRTAPPGPPGQARDGESSGRGPTSRGQYATITGGPGGVPERKFTEQKRQGGVPAARTLEPAGDSGRRGLRSRDRRVGRGLVGGDRRALPSSAAAPRTAASRAVRSASRARNMRVATVVRGMPSRSAMAFWSRPPTWCRCQTARSCGDSRGQQPLDVVVVHLPPDGDPLRRASRHLPIGKRHRPPGPGCGSGRSGGSASPGPATPRGSNDPAVARRSRARGGRSPARDRPRPTAIG